MGLGLCDGWGKGRAGWRWGGEGWLWDIEGGESAVGRLEMGELLETVCGAGCGSYVAGDRVMKCGGGDGNGQYGTRILLQ